MNKILEGVQNENLIVNFKIIYGNSVVHKWNKADILALKPETDREPIYKFAFKRPFAYLC